MTTIRSIRSMNLNELLLQISDEIDGSELERMKKLCYKLQGGNPLAISRRELAKVKEAFDLFVLQHDQHKKNFHRNVIFLLQRMTNRNKAIELTELVFDWILRNTSPDKRRHLADSQKIFTQQLLMAENQSIPEAQAPVEHNVESWAQLNFIELPCDFMGIGDSEGL